MLDILKIRLEDTWFCINSMEYVAISVLGGILPLFTGSHYTYFLLLWQGQDRQDGGSWRRRGQMKMEDISGSLFEVSGSWSYPNCRETSPRSTWDAVCKERSVHAQWNPSAHWPLICVCVKFQEHSCTGRVLASSFLLVG